MSASQPTNFTNGTAVGKKAVHVKWAGKTIALGTFPSAEADEKCARAKALTRAWRSTMRPKPTRDWVMLELERLGVRVVSGRLGRKAGEEDDEVPEKKPSGSGSVATGMGGPQQATGLGISWSSGTELDTLMQRRSSSLGLSMMSDRDLNRRGSLGSLGPVLGLDDATMPPHRPLVGGGSAAAYEAARADHYAQKREEQQRRASSLGLGMGGANMQMGLSVNPNQHYEMLKLHHMNLLNEIQETTLMMNLYQQQQLQQQQQQLQQQQASVLGNSQRMIMEELGGISESGRSSHRESLGFGNDTYSQPSLQASSKPHASAQAPWQGAPTTAKKSNAKKKAANAVAIQEELLKGQKEQEELEKRLQKLKEDIARREKEAEELQKKADAAAAAAAALSGTKRPAKESVEEHESDPDHGDGGENDDDDAGADGDDDNDDDDDDDDDEGDHDEGDHEDHKNIVKVEEIDETKPPTTKKQKTEEQPDEPDEPEDEDEA